MSRTTSPSPATALLLAGAVALVALVGGLLLGRGMQSSTAVEDPVSVGFVHDMKVHHAQAVRMSEIVHRRSADPELSYFAFDILSTQQGQIGIMTGWLDVSEQPQGGTGPAMAWMGQPHDGPMPGMASDEQIEALQTLPVPQLEQQFLELMIEHHRGGVDMASYAADHAGNGHVAALARGMAEGQQSEIDLMQGLLADRGHAPVGEGSAHSH